jgi:PAS domain S-box-containing protein
MGVINKYFTRFAAIFVFMAGLLTAIGWILDISAFKTVLPGLATMKFNSAVCFILCGTALYFADLPEPSVLAKWITRIFSGLAFLIALFTLIQYFSGSNLGIDQLFWKIDPAKTDVTNPVRMSVVTAILFFLLSLLLFFLHNKKTHFIGQGILMVTMIIAILSLLASMIRKDYLAAGLPAFYRTAFNAGLAFLILSIGIYKSQPLRYIAFSFRQKIAGYFSLFILISIMIFFVSSRNNKRSSQTSRQIEHTKNTLALAQSIIIYAQDVDIARRGYIMTARNGFITSYNKAVPLLSETVRSIKDSVSKNQIQRLRADSVASRVQLILAFAHEMIMQKKMNDVGPAELLARESTSTRLMDTLRTIVTRFEDEESALLQTRKAESQVNLENASRFSLILQILLLLMLVSVLMLIYNNNRLRNRAEQAMRDTQRQLRHTLNAIQHLMNTSYDVICTIDSEGRFVTISGGSKRLWGYDAHELAGKKYIDMVVEEDRAKTGAAAVTLQEGKSLAAFENHYYRKDGSVVPVLWTASWSEEDKMIYAIARDGTEKKLTAEELERLNKKLERKAAELETSNSELERFAYVASHDLQEPLRMVSSFLELLEKKLQGQLDEKALQYIHFSVDGADRMKKLIQDLLEYSRVGTSTEPATMVNCNTMMDEVRSIFELTIQEKNAKLNIKELPSVRGFKSQLHQLFQNLVGNALKYSDTQQPVIEVGCTDKDGNWEFYVRDNGIGIDPRFFEKIFIIFQRLHNKSEYSGTGIGLAICKKIVERHHGKIWVESTPGQGSTFYISLPK